MWGYLEGVVFDNWVSEVAESGREYTAGTGLLVEPSPTDSYAGNRSPSGREGWRFDITDVARFWARRSPRGVRIELPFKDDPYEDRIGVVDGNNWIVQQHVGQRTAGTGDPAFGLFELDILLWPAELLHALGVPKSVRSPVADPDDTNRFGEWFGDLIPDFVDVGRGLTTAGASQYRIQYDRYLEIISNFESYVRFQLARENVIEVIALDAMEHGRFSTKPEDLC